MKNWIQLYKQRDILKAQNGIKFSGLNSSLKDRKDTYERIDPSLGFNLPGIISQATGVNHSEENPRPKNLGGTSEEENYWKAYLDLPNNVPRKGTRYTTYPSMDEAIQAMVDTTGLGKVTRNYDQYKQKNPSLRDESSIKDSYENAKRILNNPNSWEGMYEKNSVYINPSKVGALQNFSGMWNPKEKALSVSDTYNFNPIMRTFAGIPNRDSDMKIESTIKYDPSKGSKWFRNLK
jgi:hypothetical protein